MRQTQTVKSGEGLNVTCPYPAANRISNKTGQKPGGSGTMDAVGARKELSEENAVAPASLRQCLVEVARTFLCSQYPVNDSQGAPFVTASPVGISCVLDRWVGQD